MIQKEKMPPILPERVVEIAWGLNLGYSSSGDSVSTTPDDIKATIKDIKSNLQLLITKKEAAKIEARKNLSEADSAKAEAAAKEALAIAEKELQEQTNHLTYIENVEAALSSCERNLRSIVKGRDQNFAQADSLMKTQIANIESSARLTADLQSALPRAFATGAGASGTIIVNYVMQGLLNYTIPAEVLAAGATIVASAFYWGYELIVAPKNVVRAQREIIKNDYRRNTYFQYYVDRVVVTLGALFNQVLSIYEAVYGEPYDSYTQEKKQEVVWNALGGKEGICGKYCPKVDKHYYSDKLSPETWCSCETGKGCEQCQFYRETTPT